ncbi:MAG TPA: hypothetical protein VGK19_13770 [Capsulimonadaceae bacterium]|jgi:hypothetical protein
MSLDIVSRHTAVFDASPTNVPTQRMPDGPLLGNGDVGVVIAGTANDQLFYIGKNDFWQITEPKIVSLATIRLTIPALQNGSYRQEQVLSSANVRGTFRTVTHELHTTSWVASDDNCLITELTNAGSTPLDVAVDLVGPSVVTSVSAQHDGPPSALSLSRIADSEPVEGGRSATVATRVIGAVARPDNSGRLIFDISPSGTVFVVSVILSDLDSADHETDSGHRAESLTVDSLHELRKKHSAWWESFWNRSSIEIPDKVIENHWYGALYVLASCSREGKIAPGLWGNWPTSDNPKWQGDYTLNYNFQAPFYIAYSSNHTELSLPLYKAITDFIPKGREMATARGWKGVHYPTHIGPWALLPEGWEDWGQRSDAAYAALNFIWYYEYTLDKAWLNEIGYPFLSQVAEFWEDYLKFENDRYVIYNDSIHEGSGSDTNPVLTLGLLRALFGALVSMAEHAHVDSARVEKWRHILAHLSAFPTYERNGRTVFRYSEAGMEWCDGNGLGIQHIFPSGSIGTQSSPELLEIATNTVGEMARWDDYNCFSSFYSAAARVGWAPADILAHLREQCETRALPNLLLYYGGGGIESCGGFAAVTEMLLQSYTGTITLFPCWPRELDARFTTLRAVGGFLVSSEISGGAVSSVEIVSEMGQPCAVANPWPGRTVEVLSDRSATVSVDGDVIQFATEPGETVKIATSRSALA